jgi:glutathione synthase/RimK-type ligase-like ATP-grasp enzyme
METWNGLASELTDRLIVKPPFGASLFGRRVTRFKRRDAVAESLAFRGSSRGGSLPCL